MDKNSKELLFERIKYLDPSFGGAKSLNEAYSQEQEAYFQRMVNLFRQKPDGFTYDLRTNKFIEEPTNGKFLVVAFGDTQDSKLGDIGDFYKVIDHAQTHERLVGGWLNKATDIHYFDSVKMFSDYDNAIQFGRENDQIGIFDYRDYTEIYLKCGNNE